MLPDLVGLPIGSIVVACCLYGHPVPTGWQDITNSFECLEQVAYFRAHVPEAGEFVARDRLFCLKKVSGVPTS